MCITFDSHLEIEAKPDKNLDFTYVTSRLFFAGWLDNFRKARAVAVSL